MYRKWLLGILWLPVEVPLYPSKAIGNPCFLITDVDFQVAEDAKVKFLSGLFPL
jgi:hypothetical protein